MMRNRSYALLLLALVGGFALGMAAPAIGQGDPTPTGELLRVIAHYAGGATEVWYDAHAATATPTGTPPPPPTHTATATHTPEPPVTAVGTLYGTEAPLPPTLTPTITPTPVAPPTQEQATPSSTPPTAPPVSCKVQLRDFNIRLRAAPTTGAVILGSVQARTTHQVFEARVNVGYLWVYDGDGWFAIRQSDWWVWRVFGTECRDLPGWPDGLPPPPLLTRGETVRYGFKTVPGARLDDLAAFANTLPDGIGSVAFVVQDTDLTDALYDTDIYTVFTPWSQFPGDCPNMSMSPANSAANRLNYVAQQAGAARFDAAVIANECAFPSAEYYRDWLLAVVAGCEARGWTCVPHVHNTGSPPLEWIDVLQPAICALERGNHYWGYNVYPYYPVPLMSDDQRTLYTTWRHRMIRDLMTCDPQWAVTELAPNGGGWPPDVQDTAAYLNATRGEFALVGVWYTGNALGAWPAARWVAPQMDSLAGAVG